MGDRKKGECLIAWCADPAVADCYCAHHAREREKWERVPPPSARDRSAKVRQRGVTATLTVWERDAEGPRVLGRAVRDPEMLGEVVAALTRADWRVQEISVSAGHVRAVVDVLETDDAEQLERRQRAMQEAALAACVRRVEETPTDPEPVCPNPGVGDP